MPATTTRLPVSGSSRRSNWPAGRSHVSNGGHDDGAAQEHDRMRKTKGRERHHNLLKWLSCNRDFLAWPRSSQPCACAAATSLLAQQAQPPIALAGHHSVRRGRSNGDAAERPEVLHPPERAAGQARVAAAGGEGGLARRGRRSAGARAPHRAHGVQRQRALQAGRAGLVLRVDRRAARPARQRVHELRRDGLHARPADRQAGDRRRRG